MAVQNNANIGFEKQIWDAACVLWGHIPAAEYRKVIVGLIFLRYISSAFEKRYQQLVEEGDGFEDDKDAYAEDNIFFVHLICKAQKSPQITLRQGPAIPCYRTGILRPRPCREPAGDGGSIKIPFGRPAFFKTFHYICEK